MLQGPLAMKRLKKIKITRRDSPDDDADSSYILGSDSNTVDAVVIPLISDDVLLPGGPVIEDAQFVAYIDKNQETDEHTEIRSGDRVIISGEKDLWVIGAFKGEVSQRIDLSESQNFTTN